MYSSTVLTRFTLFISGKTKTSIFKRWGKMVFFITFFIVLNIDFIFLILTTEILMIPELDDDGGDTDQRGPFKSQFIFIDLNM